jgi:hypothetical protein
MLRRICATITPENKEIAEREKWTYRELIEEGITRMQQKQETNTNGEAILERLDKIPELIAETIRQISGTKNKRFKYSKPK